MKKPELIIFDYNRTLFDPSSNSLFDDTLPAMEFIRNTKIPIILISRLESERLYSEGVKQISSYFDSLHFLKNKDANSIEALIARFAPNQCLSINDHLPEVELIARLGINSVWLNRLSSQRPKGVTTIHRLNELDQFVG